MRRRDFLACSGLALGSVAASTAMSGPLMRVARAGEGNPLATGKKCIFLFLHGGPSQFETFDPKPDAPSEIRCATDTIATEISGVRFGAAFPKLASLADRLAVVRSYATGSGNHDIKPVVCKESLDANLGSLYTRIVGPNDPNSGLPRNTALFPQAVDPENLAKITQFGKFAATGSLGSAYAPFEVGGGGDLQKDMVLSLDPTRFGGRKQLLSGLDRLRGSWETGAGPGELDPLRAQAYETLAGNVAEAFDLSKESPETIRRYDTRPLVSPGAIDRKWNNYQKYVANVQTLGKLLLLARRLCEAGSDFVMVTTSFVWDMHADSNNVGVVEGMGYLGGPLDYALSALMEDCEQRGIADDIMIAVTGEIGRTPKINKRGGRDHWGRLTPLLLTGGGVRGGQVIGSSDANGGEPATDAVGNQHLITTILQTMLDPAEVRLRSDLPGELLRLVGGEPIPNLFG